MYRGKSGSRWQTAVVAAVATIVISGLLYIFNESRLAQGVIITVTGAVVSLRAIEEETRQEMLAQLFSGPFVAFTALATIVSLDIALIPAVVFGVLSGYYVISATIRRHAPGVRDDSAENAQ